MTTSEIKLSKLLENGIEFSCQMCGECCRGFNEGEVYLYQEDIERLMKSLNLTKKSDLKKFAETYLKIVNDSFFWKEPGAERGKTYRFKNIGLNFLVKTNIVNFYGKIVVLYTKQDLFSVVASHFGICWFRVEKTLLTIRRNVRD